MSVRMRACGPTARSCGGGSIAELWMCLKDVLTFKNRRHGGYFEGRAMCIAVGYAGNQVVSILVGSNEIKFLAARPRLFVKLENANWSSTVYVTFLVSR